MAFFTRDFIDFFKELSADNKKEWFDLNRKRYETSIKRPFAEFVQEMIDRIRADDPAVDISTKDAIFRINRDIRFSNDKTPYKTHMAALVSAKGKKDKGYPGIYFQLSADEIRIYGGAHSVDKDILHRIRTQIAANLEEFSGLLTAKEFKNKFGEIHGEKNKRIPPEFQAAAQKQPLIFNKGFYYFSTLEGKLLLDEKLADVFMEYYQVGKPVNEFFQRAF